jgi:hypothetical protein
MSIRRFVRVPFTLVLTAGFLGSLGHAARADNGVDNPPQVFHCHGYASNGAPQRWQLFNPTWIRQVWSFG